jgi:hypothetical protein
MAPRSTTDEVAAFRETPHSCVDIVADLSPSAADVPVLRETHLGLQTIELEAL